MPQETSCPKCEKLIRLPDDAAGKKVVCAGCQTMNAIRTTDAGTLYLVEVEVEAEPAAEVPSSSPPPAPTPGRGGARRRSTAARSAPSSRGASGAPRSGRARRSPDGQVTIFVLGLIGLVLCQIVSPIAWMMGNDYLKRCKRAGATPDGLGVAGRILGIIGTCLLVLGILWVFFVFMIGAGLAASA